MLTATGMIDGESLWGVLLAGIVHFTDKDAPLVLVGGTAMFLALVWWLYWWTRRAAVD